MRVAELRISGTKRFDSRPRSGRGENSYYLRKRPRASTFTPEYLYDPARQSLSSFRSPDIFLSIARKEFFDAVTAALSALEYDTLLPFSTRASLVTRETPSLRRSPYLLFDIREINNRDYITVFYNRYVSVRQFPSLTIACCDLREREI